jgi:hypothetical protein
MQSKVQLLDARYQFPVAGRESGSNESGMKSDAVTNDVRGDKFEKKTAIFVRGNIAEVLNEVGY